MATSDKTYTFVGGVGNKVLASEVNVNFDELHDFLNNQVVHKDGSKTMTGHLTLPGTDPTTANQAARKAYVDAKAATVQASADTKLPKAGGTMTGHITLPASNPTSGNHATRKTYVDTQDDSHQAAAEAFATAAVATETTNRTNEDRLRYRVWGNDPPSGKSALITGGSAVLVSSGGAGYIVIPFTAMGAVDSYQAVISDVSAGPVNLGTAIIAQVDRAASTTSSMAVQIYRRDNGNPIPDGISVRVDWSVIGRTA